MNTIKLISTLVLAVAGLVSRQPATAAVPLPERAVARHYNAPPMVTSFSGTIETGQSKQVPAGISDYVHDAEKAAVEYWSWETKRVYNSRTIEYTGWRNNRPINVLHFLSYGGQQTFMRQYVIHYAQPNAEQETVRVENYTSDAALRERFSGKTEYVSNLMNNKLYLQSANWTDAHNAEHMALQVDWTANGVKASIASGRHSQPINLKATNNWLQSRFDLWDHFGLKFS